MVPLVPLWCHLVLFGAVLVHLVPFWCLWCHYQLPTRCPWCHFASSGPVTEHSTSFRLKSLKYRGEIIQKKGWPAASCGQSAKSARTRSASASVSIQLSTSSSKNRRNCHAHASMHAFPRVYTSVYTYDCGHGPLKMQPRVHMLGMPVCVRTSVRACACACARACGCMHACMHACVRAFIYARPRVYA